MIWITWANWAVALLTAALFVIAAFLWLENVPPRSAATTLPPVAVPKNPFELLPQAYDAIGPPVLSLQFSPMTPQLPDLRRYIAYHGKNGRPDVQQDQAHLHFSSGGQKNFASVLPHERLYLTFDKSVNPPQYNFSPNNAPTSLWFTAHAEGNQAIFDVFAIDERGNRITSPPTNLQFAVAERELARAANSAVWELDGQRVDATLFVRQKARWFGSDRFLTEHGGAEFADQADKQRIDFGDGDAAYSVYLGPHDVLIWKDKRWQAVAPGEASRAFPLIVVKKIDDRIMSLELWDTEGRTKVAINLLKSAEAWNTQIIQQAFVYEGARTRRQFIFEINGERVFLSPNDWLLLSAEGWKNLKDPKQIDDYVHRRITGTLFVFLGIERHEGKQLLIGELYSPARSDMQKIELVVQPGAKPAPALPGKGGEQRKSGKSPGGSANKQINTMPPSSSEEDFDDSMEPSESIESSEDN